MIARDPIIDMQTCTEAGFMARLNGYAELFPEIAAWGTGARASYESAQLLEGAVHRSRIMTKRLLRQRPCRRFYEAQGERRLAASVDAAPFGFRKGRIFA